MLFRQLKFKNMASSCEDLIQAIERYLNRKYEIIDRLWDILRTKKLTKKGLLMTKTFIYKQRGNLVVHDRMDCPDEFLNLMDKEHDELRKRYDDILGFVDCKLLELEEEKSKKLIDNKIVNDGAAIHYNKNDELKAKRQFENLVKEGYFLPETSLDDWLYIYGVAGKEPNKKPLEWKKTQIELAYMVRLIWQNTDTRQWVICERVFTIKGKAPNTDTMKSTLSKIDNGNKDKPRTFDKLEKLLKC